MKIVVGVDGSPYGSAAVDFVRGATWPKDTQVLVISAATPAVVMAPEAYVPAEVYTEALKAQLDAHRTFAGAAVEKLRAAGLTVDGRAVQDDPRSALLDAVTDQHADLLVVGSHGRAGLAKLVLGSVASHVVTHAPCNVLVVKLPPRG